MKNLVKMMMCILLILGISGCSSDGKDDSTDPVVTTSDRIIEEIRNSVSVKEVGVELEAELPKTNDDTTIIIYKAKKSNCELQLAINKDGKFIGAQVIGNVNDLSDEFAALVSGITNISDLNIDSELYSKIGDVIKSQKEMEVIGDLTVGISTNGATVTFSIMLNENLQK